MRFNRRIHWVDAHDKLCIENDTKAIRIEKPRQQQPVREFLEDTMDYCAKEDDTFGTRLSAEGPASVERKRQWREIIDEPDNERAWSMVRELDPRSYMLNHSSLEKAMSKKHMKYEEDEKVKALGEFRVMKIMRLWMNRYVINRKWSGRPKSLVIVGDPNTGKSTWAESFGSPMFMSARWCMSSIRMDATHLVVNDIQPSAFGYGGVTYWRDVLGGQERFIGRDF